MSLIMMLAVRDKFVATTSDSMLSVQSHLKANETVGIKRGVGNTESSKTIQLNKNVLLGIGGIVITGDEVFPELITSVEEADYLEDVARKLEKILIEKYENRLEHTPFNIKLDKKRTSLSFIGTKHFGCYLTGFLKNGNTAVACWDYETMKVVITESTIHPVLIIFSSNEQDSTDFTSWFNFGEDTEASESDYIQQLLLVHGVISFKEAETVSSDCTVQYLDKSKNFNEIKQDTSILYEVLDQAEDFSYETVSSLLI
ncbi:hypothetical protein [Vagococcus fluvialis]|uniref:hypothetical protein n=1 Tax=Vagococcus fluvialis TaxID=2738 RepID=UPI003B224199